jgi:hypothetical protein
MQTKQLHVRLSGEEMAQLKGIADECEVNTTALAGFFIRAALRAVKNYGHRLKLPPDFTIAEDASEFRGPPPTRLVSKNKKETQ